jgi:hypothetical protein
MSTANRIVLLNGRGDELFSGQSVLSEPPPPVVGNDGDDLSDDDEPIPATLRSSVLVYAREPVSRPIIVDDAPPPKDDSGHCAA